jgi:hypothetical protein
VRLAFSAPDPALDLAGVVGPAASRETTMGYMGRWARGLVLGYGLLVAVGTGAASAQVPPEASEIAACVCLQQAVATLSANMSAKNQALDAANREVAEDDSQLARERSTMNVNNPDAVARYKALLERRDAANNRSTGPVRAEAARATAQYNGRVAEYNARCANRPFNSAIVAQVQATLVCPPLQ